MKQFRLDMHNHLDSLMMSVFTIYLYAANQYIVPAIIDVTYNPMFLKIVNDGVLGILVMISAISTGVLNGYKFWIMFKEYIKNKKSTQKK